MKTILEYKSNTLPLEVECLRKFFDLTESDEDIRKILINAIEHVELEQGVSIQKKVWKIVHNNNFVVLPFAPVVKVISMCDGNGKTIEPTHFRRFGDSMAYQFDESVSVIKIVYEAGYDASTLPECFTNTIIDKFGDIYYNLCSKNKFIPQAKNNYGDFRYAFK